MLEDDKPSPKEGVGGLPPEAATVKAFHYFITCPPAQAEKIRRKETDQLSCNCLFHLCEMEEDKYSKQIRREKSLCLYNLRSCVLKKSRNKRPIQYIPSL